MVYCPFYGYSWPDRTSVLQWVGGSSCGLDFHGNRPCQLASGGSDPDYLRCPVVAHMGAALTAARRYISFETPQGELVRLSDWNPRIANVG